MLVAHYRTFNRIDNSLQKDFGTASPKAAGLDSSFVTVDSFLVYVPQHN